MRARVSKWGNSLAIRLPQAAVKSLHVREGEQIELAIRGDRVELRSARPRYRLEELVRRDAPGQSARADRLFLRSAKKLL